MSYFANNNMPGLKVKTIKDCHFEIELFVFFLIQKFGRNYTISFFVIIMKLLLYFC